MFCTWTGETCWAERISITHESDRTFRKFADLANRKREGNQTWRLISSLPQPSRSRYIATDSIQRIRVELSDNSLSTVVFIYLSTRSFKAVCIVIQISCVRFTRTSLRHSTMQIVQFYIIITCFFSVRFKQNVILIFFFRKVHTRKWEWTVSMFNRQNCNAVKSNDSKWSTNWFTRSF